MKRGEKESYNIMDVPPSYEKLRQEVNQKLKRIMEI